MLSAQPQFINHDFEQAPSGQICQDNNIGIVGWIVGSDNEGATCNPEYVCSGNRSLELKDFYRETATVANPMAIPAPGFMPIAVKFKYRVGIQESSGLINAYGTQSIGGAKTFLGKVEVSTTNNCEYQEILMPANVSTFSYFVLEIEMNTGIFWIDDIEVVYISGCEVAPSYTVSQNADWQTLAQVEAAVPGSVYGGEVHLKELILEPDVKLTIGGDITIKFSLSGILRMKKGSELALYGTLTSCGTRWGGVRMYNNSIYRSHWGSELSNAVWGISSEEWSEPNKINYLGSATIECTNALFLNNAVAIHLYAPNDGLYHGYRMLLKNCLFRKDANFDPGGRFWGFISLQNMVLEYGGDPSQASIMGCHFLNQNPTNQFNFGIESFDSDFSVTDFNGSQSRFTDLGYGIFANRRNFIAPYTVRNTDFDDCAIGIGNRRISQASVAHCTFTMGNVNPIYDGLACCQGFNYNLQVGVSNNGQMTGVDIESNVFQSMTAGLWTQGVNNFNVGTGDNRVYLDTFINLRHGNAAGNNGGLTNALPNNGSGLHFLCNENLNNPNGTSGWGFDFFIRDNLSARMNQGFGNIGNYLPARNTFSTGTNVNHFFQFNAANTNINYFAQGTVMNPVALENPTNNSANVAVFYQNVAPGCPQNFFKSDDPWKKMNELEKKENTDLYLSSKELAIDLKLAYEAAALSGNTNLETSKRREYTYQRGIMEKSANKGLYSALLDSERGDRSEIRLWMQRLDNQGGDFLLIDDYIGTRDYPLAQALLDAMEQKYEFTNEQLSDLENQRVIYEILMTESDASFTTPSLTIMEEIADSNIGQASELAKTILGELGVHYPHTIVYAPVGTDENFGDGQNNETLKKMLVSPNPADYNVTFDWQEFDSFNKDVRIEIINRVGNLIQVLTPDDGATTFAWTTEVISGGICYYRLMIDNQEVDTGHIFIIK